MVKFIDKNRKKEYYTDELLARCSCGCSIMSFRIADVENEEGDVLPALEFFVYSNGTNGYTKPTVFNRASSLSLIDPEAVLTLYGLITGKINGGHGYIETQDGNLIGIDVDPEDNSVSIHCLASEKDIHKMYKKGPQKAFKKVIWGLMFEKTEAEKKAEAERLAAEKKKAEEKAAAEAAAKRVAGAFGKGTQIGNKGTGTTGSGIEGSPTGNAAEGKSTGVGGYGTFDLNGRSLGPGGLPRPVYNVQDEGRVVVTITVNPAGQVIGTSINKRTNTVNASLRKAAEDAAKKARFNAVDGVNNQTGTITYYFKLK